MKIKTLLISCLALAFASQASAKGLTPKEALARFLGSSSDATAASKVRRAKVANKLQLAHTSSLNSENTYYVFNDNLQGGFVILSADDNMPSVLGVVDEGKFDYSNIPSNVQFYLKTLDAKVHAQARKSSPRKEEEASGKAAVEPLLKSEWDQGCPYNIYSPVYEYGANGKENAYVGCVATSMAQVMYYWKYPAQGTGSHTYKFVWDTKAGVDKQCLKDSVELSADFSQSTYEWDKMLDKYIDGDNDKTNYTDEQSLFIAALLKDCGIAAEMQYGTEAAGGSGTSSDLAGKGMVDFFGYDASLQYIRHEFYTDDEWQGTVYDELQNSRPVIFGGRGKNGSGGHSFVCDGYDGAGKFHINWGWSGKYNGYFVLTGEGMIPEGTGSGGAAAGDSYGYGMNALIHIMPNNNANATGKEDACRIATLGYTAKTSGMRLTLTGKFYNTSYRLHADTLGIQLQTSDGTAYNFVEKGSVALKCRQNVKYIEVDVSNDIPAGEYKIVPIMRGPGEENWAEIKVLSTFQAATLTVTDGENGAKTLSVTNNDAPKVEATGAVTVSKSAFPRAKKKDDGTVEAETLVLTCESGIKNCDSQGHKFCFGCEFYDLTESNDEQDVYWLSTNVKTNADNLEAGASIKTIKVDIMPELEAGHKYQVNPIFYVESEVEGNEAKQLIFANDVALASADATSKNFADDEFFDIVDEIAQYVDLGNNEAPVIEIEDDGTAIKSATTATKNTKATIYDANGRILTNANINNLPVGVYIVKDERGVRKVVRK